MFFYISYLMPLLTIIVADFVGLSRLHSQSSLLIVKISLTRLIGWEKESGEH